METFAEREPRPDRPCGRLQFTGDTVPWSEEPVGIGYNCGRPRLPQRRRPERRLRAHAGNDGRFGTADDMRFTWNVRGGGGRRGHRLRRRHQLVVVRRRRGVRPAQTAGGIGRAARHLRRRVDALGLRHLRTAGPRRPRRRLSARDHPGPRRRLADDLRTGPQRGVAQHDRHLGDRFGRRRGAGGRSQHDRQRAELLRRRTRCGQQQRPRRERRSALRDHQPALRWRRRSVQPGAAGLRRERPVRHPAEHRDDGGDRDGRRSAQPARIGDHDLERRLRPRPGQLLPQRPGRGPDRLVHDGGHLRAAPDR